MKYKMTQETTLEPDDQGRHLKIHSRTTLRFEDGEAIITWSEVIRHDNALVSEKQGRYYLERVVQDGYLQAQDIWRAYAALRGQERQRQQDDEATRSMSIESGEPEGGE